MPIFRRKPKTFDDLIEKHDQRVRDNQHSLLYKFFVPSNSIEVIFIIVCFALAWYAVNYDIPQAKLPVLCNDFWLEKICPCSLDPYYYERALGWNRTSSGLAIPELNQTMPDINIDIPYSSASSNAG